MNQTKSNSLPNHPSFGASIRAKKMWERPLVLELDVQNSQYGGGSVLSDSSNTSSATRTS